MEPLGSHAIGTSCLRSRRAEPVARAPGEEGEESSRTKRRDHNETEGERERAQDTVQINLEAIPRNCFERKELSE
jgi:hypothetical protein